MNRMEQGIASIPRQTMIRDQPHMLAYITPAEAMPIGQRPANKAYTFQELLGMYQNPYA